MGRFLIEVQHEATQVAYARAVELFLRTQAKVVQLNAFTMKDIEGILQHHKP